MGNSGDPYRFLRCHKGAVLAIIESCGGVEFIRGYCRVALFDQWGLWCGEVFIRCNNADLTRSWACPVPGECHIFRPTRLELVAEEEWMSATE